MLEADLAGDAALQGRGVWTTTGDLALPLLTTERELAAGDVLWTDVEHHVLGATARTSGAPGWSGETPTARQQAQFEKWRDILDRGTRGDEGRGDVR